MIQDENVYVEGARHFWRFHGKNTYEIIHSTALYVGTLVIIAGLCWLAAHALVMLPHPAPHPHHYRHVAPANIGQTYSQYLKAHNLPNFTTFQPTRHSTR